VSSARVVVPMSATPDVPLVSVIVPCYNQGRFLHDSLQSIRAQSHAAVESILVDDGSTDDTASKAATMPWTRYVLQRNAGAPAARNSGLSHSRGAFVVFLDADDRLLPDAIATGLAALRLLRSGRSRRYPPPPPWQITLSRA